MSLAMTLVSDRQDSAGHTIISPDDLAQLMSTTQGQPVTGILNPDGTITLNAGILPQHLTLSHHQHQSLPQTDMQAIQTTAINQNSYSNNQATMCSSNNTVQQQQNDRNNTASINKSCNNNTTTSLPVQKKKRISAKQRKLMEENKQQEFQQQQQQQQQQNMHDMQSIYQIQQDQQLMLHSHVAAANQPKVVATVQLPNGQIGQLIAPPGVQLWSPSSINLQQLSLAVAAATGTMPQTLSIPTPVSIDNLSESTQNKEGNQVHSSSHQSDTISQTAPCIKTQTQQISDDDQSTTNQIGTKNNDQQSPQQTNSASCWPTNSIGLSPITALTQQGVVHLSSISGLQTLGSISYGNMTNSQATNSNNDGSQNLALPFATTGNHFLAQDSNNPGKWQILTTAPINDYNNSRLEINNNNQSTNRYTVANNNSELSSTSSNVVYNNCNNSSMINSSGNSIDSTTNPNIDCPPKKLKRLACACPNCRLGENGKLAGAKKQHICHFPDCNKVYGKTSHLRAHLRWHNGERPYVCNWSSCGKKFTRSDELQRHKRTHTGEKRFECQECSKKFMRSDHLSKHIKTHLVDKKSNNANFNITQVKVE